MTNPEFVTALKKRYFCKIILVCHYTNWSFSLLGNEKKLYSLLNKKYKQKTIEEKEICKSVNEDVKMIKKCDRFVCVATHSLNTFLKISSIDSTRCTVIYNAIKDEYSDISIEKKMALKKKYWISENTKTILFVGRLDEIKGVSYLLKAFKNLLKRRTDIHLLLAGEGDFSRWLNESSNCWTKISFTGRLNKKKITELYKIADIGVVSSIHEEFGLVAIEMMMHKLPIIVGDTGGLSEIVEDQVSGLKVPIRTIRGIKTISYKILTDKMDLLLNNEKISKALSQNGRSRFLKKYELSTFQRKMKTLYDSL